MDANACDERPISENELCAATKRWTEAGAADAERAPAPLTNCTVRSSERLTLTPSTSTFLLSISARSAALGR